MVTGHQWPGVIIPVSSHCTLLWVLCWDQRTEECVPSEELGRRAKSSGHVFCFSGSSAIQVGTEWQAISRGLPYVGWVSLGPSTSGQPVPIWCRTWSSAWLGGHYWCSAFLSVSKWEEGSDAQSYNFRYRQNHSIQPDSGPCGRASTSWHLKTLFLMKTKYFTHTFHPL